MRVLVACEFSGVVRDAFRRQGHDAWSCDLLPCSFPNSNWKYHIQGDVRPLLKELWDLVIAHPPCTYLTKLSATWLDADYHTRYPRLLEAAEFFRECLHANAPRVCCENPIPMHLALKKIGVQYTQKVQPYWFGDHHSKWTCLWLKGLPMLQPTSIVKPNGRYMDMHRSQSVRSITPRGLAEAMAVQWDRSA